MLKKRLGRVEVYLQCSENTFAWYKMMAVFPHPETETFPARASSTFLYCVETVKSF
jgi:hypothetical protein